MLLLYAYVLWKVRDVGRRTHPDHESAPAPGGSKEHSSKSTIDLTYYAFGIHLTYFVLWAPTVIFYMVSIFGPSLFPQGWRESPERKIVVFVIKLLSYVGGVLSPFFYTRHNHGMKIFLRAMVASTVELLQRLVCLRKDRVAVELEGIGA